MKLKILLLLFGCATSGWAQKIYFPKQHYADSVTIAKNLVILAEKAIPLYEESNKVTYLDNLFRLELTAKKYQTIEATLNKMEVERFGDSISNNYIGFGYRVYAKTMLKQPKTKEEFESRYKESFHSVYKTLDNNGQ